MPVPPQTIQRMQLLRTAISSLSFACFCLLGSDNYPPLRLRLMLNVNIPTNNVLRKAGAAVLPFSIFLFLLVYPQTLRMMHLHQMARIIGGFDPVQDAIRKYLA